MPGLCHQLSRKEPTMRDLSDHTTTEKVEVPPIPLPKVANSGHRSWPHLHLAVSTMDRSGRLSDRSTLSYLSWLPTQPVSFDLRDGLVIVHDHAFGGYAVDSRGYLRLPAHARHCIRVDVTDRLLLAARRQPPLLLIYSPPTAHHLLGSPTLGDGAGHDHW